jgi:twinkle protein
MNKTSRLDAIAEKLAGVQLPDIDYEKYYKSIETDNQKIKRVVDFYDEIEDFFAHGDEISGAKLPFSKTHQLFGFRGGEVTLWTGYNGHKKSMLLGYVALDLMKQQESVCIASFEMKPISTLNRMVRQFSGLAKPTENEFGDFMMFAHEHLFIFDHLGGISPNRLYGVIYYAATELKVKHFVIDSLMRVVAGEEDRSAEKDFVVKLCEIAQSTNCHIHLVHHVRDGDESKPSTRYSAKGSKSISDNVHNSLIVWSNKNKLPDMPDVILKCDKQREGEWEGMIALSFDADSLTFSERFGGY